MAVTGSNNENSTALKKFVGLENFKVIAVNPPSVKAWNDLGFNFEKEPEYLVEKEDDGKKYKTLRLDFVLHNAPEEGEEEIKLIHSIYVDTRISVSKTDKKQFCNKFGQFAWLPSLSEIPDNMGWFNTDGARESFKNEELLIDFLRNYANVSKGGECYIENPKALLNGDVNEVRDVINEFPNNKIKILLTIKIVDETDDDGNVTGQKFYQSTYTRKTERPYSTDFSYLSQNIDQWQENGGGKNMIIPNSPYKLSEWNGLEPDAEQSEESKEATTAW